jgi:hypothetical protein
MEISTEIKTDIPRRNNKAASSVDRILQDYLDTPEAFRPEKDKELSYAIQDPRNVAACELLSDSSELKREALIVADAFEAATNGMDAPETIELLHTVRRDGPFAAWLHLISALRSFYAGRYEEMARACAAIPEEHPVHCLIHVLSSIASQTIPKEGLGPLSGLIQDNRGFFESAKAQLEESRDHGYEDVFIDTSVLLIGDLAARDQAAAKMLAGWCLTEASEADFSPLPIIASLKNLFGVYEGLRITARAFLEKEPDVALLFYARALKEGLKEGLMDVHEGKKFVRFIASIAERTRLDRETERSFREIVRSIAEENPSTELSRSLRDITSGMEGTGNKQVEPKTAGKRDMKGQVHQLELFI